MNRKIGDILNVNLKEIDNGYLLTIDNNRIYYDDMNKAVKHVLHEVRNRVRFHDIATEIESIRNTAINEGRELFQKEISRINTLEDEARELVNEV